MAYVNEVKLKNEDGSLVDVQHPVFSGGDSVYVKDLDQTNCDNGN